MSIVLHTIQREQAGSDSYNRLEYQTHWIVCHIINQLEANPECIIFCEFHDDMAQIKNSASTFFEFYQIKTKEESDNWSIAELSKKSKRSDGSYKKSFLGFIFYNFMTFGHECLRCHFVSNNGFDIDVRMWQAYIEDDINLKNEDSSLFYRIKGRIETEYGADLPTNFEAIFERFVQNTFLYQSELKLDTFKDQVSGQFFRKLANKNIPANTANLILEQIVNDVRKKSCLKIQPPISFTSLVNKKGVKLTEINEILNRDIPEKSNYSEFKTNLSLLGLSSEYIAKIIEAKSLHDTRWLNIEDIKYQETVILLKKTIIEYLQKSGDIINSQQLHNECKVRMKKYNLTSEIFEDTLIEVLAYEQQFAKSKSAAEL